MALLSLCFSLFALESWQIQWELNKYDSLFVFRDTSSSYISGLYDEIVLVGKVVTMEENSEGNIIVLDDGVVVVAGEKIVWVGERSVGLPSSIDTSRAFVVNTNGIIFPGLINAHDHIHYNFLPLWNVPKRYTNRYQWGDDKSHVIDVKYWRRLISEKKYFRLDPEAVKYAEVKQLISGTTSVQGSPSGSKRFCRMLVRNMDVSPNFGENRMSSYVRPIGNVDGSKVASWIGKMEAGELRALFLHIGEGTDKKSRDEFDVLVRNGLGRKEAIVIHGVALDEPEIKYMAENNMTLVWSPTSNLLLYGKTANIPLFVRYGVNIALGTDWSPSGGKNLLCEMKIAYEYAKEKWPNLLTTKDIVKMVTVNPARACGWENYVGKIKEGLFADLFVIKSDCSDPFEALIRATERDVVLVMVGGDPLYGDCELMRLLKPGDHEVLSTSCGFSKCIDVTKQNVEYGWQTLKEIIDTLSLALSADTNYMKAKFNDEKISNYKSFSQYLKKEFPGLHPVLLDPIFPSMDRFFFFMLNSARNPDWNFDIQYIYYSW